MRIQIWSLNDRMVCVTTGCGCFRGDGLSQRHGGTLSSLNRVCWGSWIIWVVSMVAILSTALFFFLLGKKSFWSLIDFWWLNENTEYECWWWLSHCSLCHSCHFVKIPAIIWTLTLSLNMCLAGKVSTKSYISDLVTWQMSTLSPTDQ